MFKRAAVALVFLILFASPIFTSAQSTTQNDDALIKVLLQLVQLLEQELAALEGSAPGSTAPTLPHICPVYTVPACTNGTLTWSSGTDANGCQVPPTCTPNTTTTPAGTRQSCPVYFYQACVTNTTSTYTPATTDTNGCTIPGHYQCFSSSFDAAPVFGAAPLLVSFTASGILDAGYYYRIDFGDGQTPIALGGQYTTAMHTYSASGTYTAQLEQTPNPCASAPPNVNCDPAPPGSGNYTWTTIRTATITVN